MLAKISDLVGALLAAMKNKLPIKEKTGRAREKFCATIAQESRIGKSRSEFKAYF
jgi:hypothetical protein